MQLIVYCGFCRGLNGIDSIVQVHLNAAMSVGLSKVEVYQLISLIEIEFYKE